MDNDSAKGRYPTAKRSKLYGTRANSCPAGQPIAAGVACTRNEVAVGIGYRDGRLRDGDPASRTGQKEAVIARQIVPLTGPHATEQMGMVARVTRTSSPWASCNGDPIDGAGQNNVVLTILVSEANRPRPDQEIGTVSGMTDTLRPDRKPASDLHRHWPEQFDTARIPGSTATDRSLTRPHEGGLLGMVAVMTTIGCWCESAEHVAPTGSPSAGRIAAVATTRCRDQSRMGLSGAHSVANHHHDHLTQAS